MGSLPLLYINAEVAEKIGLSIQCKQYEISCRALGVILLIPLIFCSGLCIIHIPFFQPDRKSSFLLYVPFIILLANCGLLYTGLNVMSHICVSNLKRDCRNLLGKDIMKLEDVQEIIDRYERIKHGLSLPAFVALSVISMDLILSLYIGISG